MIGYVLSDRAQFDLREIWSYSFNQWGEDQAERYMAELRSAIEAIAESPQLGRPCDEIRRGHFKFLVGSHVVFYRKMDREIAIVRVLHQHMNFTRHL